MTSHVPTASSGQGGDPQAAIASTTLPRHSPGRIVRLFQGPRTDRPRDAYQSRAVPDGSRVRETGKEIRDRTIEILQRTSFEALVKRSGGRWLSAIN